jgi:hypothetical protein
MDCDGGDASPAIALKTGRKSGTSSIAPDLEM